MWLPPCDEWKQLSTCPDNEATRLATIKGREREKECKHTRLNWNCGLCSAYYALHAAFRRPLGAAHVARQMLLKIVVGADGASPLAIRGWWETSLQFGSFGWRHVSSCTGILSCRCPAAPSASNSGLERRETLKRRATSQSTKSVTGRATGIVW
jgi:hypothetical protein